MNSDPDPFEQGERAAARTFRRKPIRIGMAASEHALWAAGHEKVAGAREANESEGG